MITKHRQIPWTGNASCLDNRKAIKMKHDNDIYYKPFKEIT